MSLYDVLSNIVYSINPIAGAGMKLADDAINNAKEEAIEDRIASEIKAENYPNYIKYDPTNLANNYKGAEVNQIVNLIGRTGIDVSGYDNSGAVNLAFDKIVKAYQAKNGMAQNGIVNEEFVKNLQDDVINNYPPEVKENTSTADELYNDDDTETDEDKPYDPHYEPYFLNESEKLSRRNHKDIVISLGDNHIYKRIKDVYMRSVGIEVDTSGKPVTEVYQFVARDVVESDAPEDENIYLGEEAVMEASSDIKYNYDSLFKDR